MMNENVHSRWRARVLGTAPTPGNSLGIHLHAPNDLGVLGNCTYSGNISELFDLDTCRR
jgi:hypothetical protein